MPFCVLKVTMEKYKKNLYNFWSFYNKHEPGYRNQLLLNEVCLSSLQMVDPSKPPLDDQATIVCARAQCQMPKDMDMVSLCKSNK